MKFIFLNVWKSDQKHYSRYFKIFAKQPESLLLGEKMPVLSGCFAWHPITETHNWIVFLPGASFVLFKVANDISLYWSKYKSHSRTGVENNLHDI